jgi:hypothetical protein
MSKLAFLILGAALLSSCTLFLGSQNQSTVPSSLDIAAFQKSFMSSYYAERSGAPAGVAGGPRALTPFNGRSASGSRATVPVDQYGSLSWASLLGTTTTIAGSYPEPGQTTSFVVSSHGTASNGNPIYDVKATTVFPSTDIRKSYLEEYYVEDSSPGSPNTGSTWAAADGSWTVADPVVKDVGGVWTQDQSARAQMLLTFQDGSTRNETIVSSSLSGGPLFDPTAFSVSGSLDLSQAFVPATAHAGQGVVFSSVVMYYVTPTTNYSYWFWSGSNQQTILGIRYYTEVLSGSNYSCYTISFEKTIGTLTTTGGSFTSTLKTVVAGSTFDTLAESVLRQQIVYGLKAGNPTLPDLTTGQTTTNMQSRVVNIAGKKDFYLQQINSDNVSLSSWDSSTIYVPTGDATEIVAGDSSANVYARSQQISPATGTLPIAVVTVGSGDLATVYGSIMSGTATTSVPGTPSGSNLMGSGPEYSFNGQQAVGNTTQSTLNLAQAGTIEAWVYVNQMTDTAGIVHKGVDISFGDECFSLQGWSSDGTIAIVLDQPTAGNSYDLVTSKTKLNQKKWYYLAATWDALTKKICLYLNGVLDASGTMNVTSSGVRNNSSAILVGSQLPSIYSSQYGYFGLDGRIVGANVTASALTLAQIVANYNAYKGNTKNW